MIIKQIQELATHMQLLTNKLISGRFWSSTLYIVHVIHDKYYHV